MDSEFKIENISEFYDKIDNQTKFITSNYLTKYEKTKLLGIRANDIDHGSKLFISVDEISQYSSLDLAEMELEQQKLPYIVKRYLPNNKIEYRKLSDLKIL